MSPKNTKEKGVATQNNDDWYYIGAFLTGAAVFIGIWIYSSSEWGLLLGLMFGWIPALIGAYIAGFLWPIILLVILAIFIL